jgi:UDP-glucose 4-epimerase
MASRGSVIPLFVDQIKAGKPITVTDPNMTRFMMSMKQSVELVEFAFTNAQPGDIFVQKSPAATIHDLALALKDIFNSKSEIKVIGTRHGEKLHETLLNREEMVKAIDLGDYFRVPADNRDLNYALYFTKGEVKTSAFEDYNSNNTQRLTLQGTKDMLLSLEYIQQKLKQSK